MQHHKISSDAFTRLLGMLASIMLIGSAYTAVAEPQPPNILIVIADDLHWYDMGCMGNDQVRTPHIDRLAKEGMAFDAAFTSTAMCAPTRQQLLTGLWPVRSGAWPNHSGVYKGVKSLPHHLKSLGYRTGHMGKGHFKPKASYPFEYLGDVPKHKGLPEQLPDLARSINTFIKDAGDKPWCLYYASHNPHSPFTQGDPSRFPAHAIKVPLHLPDTPYTKEQLSLYYAEVEMLDAELGMLLKTLEGSGQSNRTLIIFTSEQGAAHVPLGGKWTCWDHGLKTALIARLPGVIKPGTRTSAMVQYIDVLPTLIDLAGGNPAKIDTGIGHPAKQTRGFDGISFADVLKGKSEKHRNLVYGIQTTNGIINGSKSYPIRSVRDERWLMVWNLNADNEPFRNLFHKHGEALWEDWSKAAKEDPVIAKRIAFYQNRPEFELYDIEADPHQLNNLADDRKHAERLRDMHDRLEAWMKNQGDEGFATEAKAKERQGKK
ncbi:MAG: sulfatase [Planctomycetota bacterium]